jgi:hypothetical protein
MTHITSEDLRWLQFKSKKKESKYHNEPTYIDNTSFASKGEGHRYKDLKLKEKAGAISDIELQPCFELQPAFKQNGKKYRAIFYKADFKYKENGKIIIEDFKGFSDKVFRIKEKLFRYKYPDLELRIVK